MLATTKLFKLQKEDYFMIQLSIQFTNNSKQITNKIEVNTILFCSPDNIIIFSHYFTPHIWVGGWDKKPSFRHDRQKPNDTMQIQAKRA